MVRMAELSTDVAMVMFLACGTSSGWESTELRGIAGLLGCPGRRVTSLFSMLCVHYKRLSRGYGGETGIRTLDTLRYTRFPSVRLQPLGHLSALFNFRKSNTVFCQKENL